MADVKFLYDTFNMYYNRGMNAKEQGQIDIAKKNLLFAAETLLKMAKESKGELQKSRVLRANRLVELANNLEEMPKDETKKATKTIEDEAETQFVKQSVPTISFNDVAGLYEVKEAINNRIILPLKYPEIYKRFDKEIGGGVLLYGPPGTGKTLIAKAIAHEANADFYAIKCSDIVSKWFGEAEQNIKKLFDTVSKSERAIIFFDEFEALAQKRDDTASAMKRIVPELLSQIQGFTTCNKNLLLLAATNRPWDIDSAFLRPGRFNELIYIGLPDYEARLYMIKKHLSHLPIQTDLSFEELAVKTEGYNGADIKELCERMKDLPIRRMIEENNDNDIIKQSDALWALEKVKSSVNNSEIERFKDFNQNKN